MGIPAKLAKVALAWAEAKSEREPESRGPADWVKGPKTPEQILAEVVVRTPFKLAGIDIEKKVKHFWRGFAMGARAWDYLW